MVQAWLKSSWSRIKREILNKIVSTWAKANDIYYGIDTDDVGFSDIVDPARGYPFAKQQSTYMDGIFYQAVDYRNIRRITRLLNLDKADVFFELGCGKGRVCCVFARWELRRVVGIELNDSLCDVARKNAERLREKRTTIEVRCEDVVTSDLSEGTIYFMFNPFGPKTMCHVLQNIRRSLETMPRKITIIYYNPVCAELLRTAEWLQQVDEFKTLTGRRVTFWKSL